MKSVSWCCSHLSGGAPNVSRCCTKLNLLLVDLQASGAALTQPSLSWKSGWKTRPHCSPEASLSSAHLLHKQVFDLIGILFSGSFLLERVTYLGRTCAMRQRSTKITHQDVFNDVFTEQQSLFAEGQERRRSETCSCLWGWTKWQKRDSVTSCGTCAECLAPQKDISEQ